jgi:glycosyltransferase involved in cell wall biosynthesis
MARSCDGVIVAGSNAVQFFGRLNGNVKRFVASGVRSEEIEAVSTTRLPGEPLRILLVGRVTPVKGIEYLVDAMGKVHAKGASHGSVEVRIVGPIDEALYKRELDSRARQLGVDSHIKFVGPLPRGTPLADEYRRAHVLVVSSLKEGTPKVIPEAFARGLPVIGTDVGSVRDVLLDGVNGLLVPPGESVSLAEAIMCIAEHEPLRYRLGQAALASAPQFTIDRQMGEVRAWVESAVASRAMLG